MKKLRWPHRWRRDRRKTINASLAVTSLVAVTMFARPVCGAERQVVRVHLPAAATHLQPLGPMTGSQRLNLAIGLHLRNQQALNHLLQQIYDPASPDYHHFLTPEQFTAQFGPSEQDYQAVIAFAKANGLTVTAGHSNRLLVDVSGSVADIDRVLHVRMQVYQHPTENRTFYAPDVEPSLDLAVPILDISGLNNYSLPRPRLKNIERVDGQTVVPNAGSGPGGTYMGKDFRAAYVPDTTLD
ncbi:MAG TPA: protease pro-enzyme activation domain-containing protein, partial [Verrucomicrobiae bacterium]|nr:protease pro-enzyme activation domain-containing protein [Verrucomicrobiae bacterium]